MANVYLISDDYFTNQYPEHKSLDMSKFYSTLLMEQNTTLESILGETLKAWLIDNANSTLTGDQLELLTQSQYLLVFLVAKQLSLIGRSNDNSQEKDVSSMNVMGKISYLKAKVKTLINDSTALQTLLNSDDTYLSATKHDYPIYFPR